MSLDDIDLDQVRESLVRIKEKAYERFEGMSSAELAVYFTTGISTYSHDSLGRDLNSLQNLINFYVETRSSKFQEKYMYHLNGKNRPNEVYEVELNEYELFIRFAKGISDTVRFYEAEKTSPLTMHDFGVKYSNLLGFRDRFRLRGLNKKVSEEKIRVAKEMVRRGQRSGRKR